MKTKITVKEFKLKTIQVPIRGTTPLIVSRRPDWLIEELNNKSSKAASAGKVLHTPEEQYKQSVYRSKDGWEGVPASAFKGALARGAKICGMVMIDVKTSISIMADCRTEQLVKIEGKNEMFLGMRLYIVLRNFRL